MAKPSPDLPYGNAVFVVPGCSGLAARIQSESQDDTRRTPAFEQQGRSPTCPGGHRNLTNTP